MKHKIVCMSDMAFTVLQTANTGTVHSVYRKTINIDLGGTLLALQAERSPLSPVSLITDLGEASMENLDISPGLIVHLLNSSIIINGHAFNYKNAERIFLKFSHSFCKNDLKILKSSIAATISSSNTNGFDIIFQNSSTKEPSPEEMLFSPTIAARKYMTDAGRLFFAGNHAESAASLVRLVGLGKGLTPSGDDFLCGALAGLTLSGNADTPFDLALKEQIRRSLGGTNDISAAFLKCALEGQYSLPVNQLTELPSSDALAASFGAIGHSSGIDTLCGILYILCLYLPDMPKNCTRRTASPSSGNQTGQSA